MSERTLIHDCQYWSCKSAPKSMNTTNHLLLQTQVNSAAPTGLDFLFCKYVRYIRSKHLIRELIRDIDLFANMTRLQTSSSNIPAIISLIVKQGTTKLQFITFMSSLSDSGLKNLLSVIRSSGWQS